LQEGDEADGGYASIEKMENRRLHRGSGGDECLPNHPGEQ
jgi:hypothetical protein